MSFSSEEKIIFAFNWFFDPIDQTEYFNNEDDAYKYGCLVLIDQIDTCKGKTYSFSDEHVRAFARMIANAEYKSAVRFFQDAFSCEAISVSVEKITPIGVCDNEIKKYFEKFISENNYIGLETIITREFFRSWITFSIKNLSLYSDPISEKVYNKIIDDARKFSDEFAKHIDSFKYIYCSDEPYKFGFHIPERLITDNIDKIFVNNKG